MTEWRLSRRQLLKTMAATGAMAAADLGVVGRSRWSAPRRAWGAAPVRFQFSVPEPKRTALVESLVQRFNQSQKDFEVKVEFVPAGPGAPEAHHRRSPPATRPTAARCGTTGSASSRACSAVEDLTPRVKDWKHYADVLPIAWQTVTVKGKILSLPWVVTNDGVYWRIDRAKEYGIKPPRDDWTWDDFLATARAFTKPDKNQYGFGMRGQGTWAVLYATRVHVCQRRPGAEGRQGRDQLEGGRRGVSTGISTSIRKYKVTPPSVATDGWRQIVEGFGRGVTNMYVHNSGSCEEQKGFVGAQNFATVPLPVGPAKKRASF